MSYYPCVKNDSGGYVFYTSLISQADTKLFQVNPTLAAGDVKIAIDDGAPANLGTLPAVDGDFTKRVKVTLSQAETNGDNLTIIFSDAAGSEWCDQIINIQTSAQTLDTIDTNVDSILTDTGTTLPATLATIDGIVDAILVDTGTTLDTIVDSILADTAELQTSLASGGTVYTIVAAVKAKTDNLPGSIPKNVALSNFPVTMVLSSDHYTPATGKTVTAQISKDGGAFASCSNSVSEIGNGEYKINITQTEMNADIVILKFTETDCDQVVYHIKTDS